MIRKTITSIFMVPTLNIPKTGLNSGDFINGYIKDLTHDIEYSDSIHLLFKPSDIDKFREFLNNEYGRTKMIVEDYDYDGGYVVVVYKLDMSYKEDFNLIREGKYSKTSEEFQKLFPIIMKIKVNDLHRDELSLQYRVFNKTGDLKEFWEKEFDMGFDDEQEVWRGWNEEEEILQIDKIRENVE